MFLKINLLYHIKLAKYLHIKNLIYSLMENFIFFAVYRSEYIQVFLLCLKSNNIQTLKCSSWKNFFSTVYIICKLGLMNIFIPFDNWKTLFLIKVYCYPIGFFNHHVLAFFETSVLKAVRILHYLRNNSAILILKFQKNFPIIYFLNALN